MPVAARSVLRTLPGAARRTRSWFRRLLPAFGTALACVGVTASCLATERVADPSGPSSGISSAATVASKADHDGPRANDAVDPLRSAALVAEGEHYEHAEGVARDYGRAFALYCEAARMNDGEAFLRMGWMVANGRGLERDDGVAGRLLQQAAMLGNPTAARLAAMIRGDGEQERLPECLQPPRAPETTPARSWADITYDLDFDDPVPATIVRPLMPAALRTRLQAPLARLAREYRLDPGLVLAVMRAESGFNPLALSPRNAQGLMQLIPETAERFAVRNAFDPVENLRGGMRYLRWLLSYFEGDVRLALAGYNAGEGAVDRARGVPPWPETRRYIARILGWYPHEFHPFEPQVTIPATWLRARTDPADAEKTSSLR